MISALFYNTENIHTTKGHNTWQNGLNYDKILNAALRKQNDESHY